MPVIPEDFGHLFCILHHTDSSLGATRPFARNSDHTLVTIIYELFTASEPSEFVQPLGSRL